jgi:hypothetical protein
MSERFSSLAIRVVVSLGVCLHFVSCIGEGADQLHGMVDFNFSSTAVCNAQIKLVPFRNSSGSEMVIEGAAISAGTDPLGNFDLLGVIVGGVEIPSVNSALNNVTVPVGTDYSFEVKYAPRTENETHTAILDIAFAAPEQGIVQVTLTGTSTTKTDTCPSQDVGGPVGFDGEVKISIDKLVLINGANSQLPIRSDQHVPSEPYVPPVLDLTLDLSGGDLLLEKIDLDDSFVLPPPDPLQVPALASLIKNDTVITSFGEAAGTYTASSGTLEIDDLGIHLDNPADLFTSDLFIDVTTGALDFTSTGMSSGDILKGGFTIIGNTVVGSPLQADSGRVVLVGISAFTNATGKLGDIINNRPAILRIEATIQDPTP